jgi:pilus assembly protein CpaE
VTGHGNGDGNSNGRSQSPVIRVLIAESDEEQRAKLREALGEHKGFDVVASVGDGERAVRLAAQLPLDVAVLEMGMQRSNGSDMVEGIALTNPYCQLIVISDSDDPEIMRKAMAAGAREFLVKPVGVDQLVAAVLRIHNISIKRQGSSEEALHTQDRVPPARVFAIWGPKGGVGRTFLAVNLAVCMATHEQRRVLLMDGCLSFCTVDVALDIEGKKTIFDLVVDNEDDLDANLIGQVVVHHASGVDVLLAPAAGDMLAIAPAHLQRILTAMRRQYDCILIDTRPLLDETTIAFLDLSDVILTICNPEIASLRNLRVFLDSASRLGYSSDKIKLIINRADMKEAISAPEIEKVCRHHIFRTLPNDHEAVAASINRGQPLVITHPQRAIAWAIRSLASDLAENNGHRTERGSKLALARLFGRTRAVATPEEKK